MLLPFSPRAQLLAIGIATILAFRAVTKKTKSLTYSGAIVAWVVGYLSVVTGLRGLILLVFYQIGSWATKYKRSVKQSKDATAAAASEGTARGPSQVLACSFPAVMLSLERVRSCGEEEPIDYDKDPLAASLTCAILAHHATCLADTLASELGMLTTQTPIMITQPWRRVPPGTNGGITAMGTLWSAVGGLVMSLSQVLVDVISGLSPLNVVFTLLFGTICGMIGSVLDSIFGATIQATYYDDDTKRVYHSGMERPKKARLISGMDILKNEQVNLVSVALTTVLGGWIIGPWLYATIH